MQMRGRTHLRTCFWPAGVRGRGGGGVRETGPRVIVLTWRSFQEVGLWCPVASVPCLLSLLHNQFLAVFKYRIDMAVTRIC